MSYLEAPYYYSRGGVAYFDGKFITGTRDASGFSIAGSTPEIDVTTLISPRREFVPGLADGGGIGMNVVASMNSEIYAAFEESNDKQLTKKLDIFFGGIPSDERRTDGGPIDVIQGLKIFVQTGALTTAHDFAEDEFAIGVEETNAAPTSGETKISCKKDYADGLANGITVGDFVEVRPGGYRDNAYNAAVYHRITNIAENTAGTRIVFTLKGASTISAATFDRFNKDASPAEVALTGAKGRTSTFNIVRPAARFSIPVYIQDFQHNTGAGGLIEMQVAYRITGKGDLYIGDQRTSADTKPTSPYLDPLPTWFWAHGKTKRSAAKGTV